MPIIKPFRGWKPLPAYAKSVASPPYDVISVAEARILAKGNPYSFLHVVKPEINFPEDPPLQDPKIYFSGKRYFQHLIEKEVLVQDNVPSIYLYQLQMENHTQTGILALASIDDYFSGVIKVHELTRPEKEEDRKHHVRIGEMHPEPVFFAYPTHDELEIFIDSLLDAAPALDFLADDGIYHRLWVVSDPSILEKLVAYFAQVPSSYVADGHHRTAAAAVVGKELREQHPAAPSDQPYDYFMAVHFPDSQLQILDYNRVVQDLNGWEPFDFLEALRSHFRLEPSNTAVKPQRAHQLGMYLSGKWYSLEALPHTYESGDPIAELDVTILSQFILAPLLGINDLRKDPRIDFVGGIRGMDALESRVNSGEMAVAFSLFPVSMAQLMAIADSGQLMPPKSTWFEPKLRSGLVTYTFYA